MKTQEQSLKDFIEQLNAIDKNQDAVKSEQNTISLLQVHAELTENDKAFKEKTSDENFQQKISGAIYVDEVFGNQSFKRPVIDLVQQGGAMLGIALLGYTYTMEKAGIRFRSMAGTSAGAINTLLLSALPDKIYQEKSPFIENTQAVKSEMLAYLVANKNFADFLDKKDGFIGKLQHFLLRHINRLEKWKNILIGLAVLTPFALSYLLYWLLNKTIFKLANGLTENEIKVYNYVSGTVAFIVSLLLLLMLLFGLFRKKMGINPGNAIYKWLTDILQTTYVRINTTKDLTDRKEAMQLKHTNNEPATSKARIVMIAANLTHNRIVKFPDNSADYWEDADKIFPAAYVRASMSLPFIFQAFIPEVNHIYSVNNMQLNKKVRMLARFVDGGMLSNFPIREFHVPPPTVPRYPTFGVLLGSDVLKGIGDNKQPDDSFWNLSVFKYILSFISTFRNFYDKEFLQTHEEFKQLVQQVNTKEFNSLDFGMNFEIKKKLFAEGVKAAMQQIKTFDWDTYQDFRIKQAKNTN